MGRILACRIGSFWGCGEGVTWGEIAEQGVRFELCPIFNCFGLKLDSAETQEGNGSEVSVAVISLTELLRD